MASKESEALNTLYREWVAALEVSPEMPLDELRHLFERWGDITGEPGGVDYIETDAGGVPALWAVPKGCVEDRVLLCAHGGGYVVGSMYTHRKLYLTSPRQSAAARLSCITGGRRKISIPARSTTWRETTNGCSTRAFGQIILR